MSLIAEYKAIVDKYIKAFCEKQDVEFDYWIGEDIGGTACFGDFYFNFDDIRYDIDNNIPKETIFTWYYYSIDNYSESTPTINYRTYTKIK